MMLIYLFVEIINSAMMWANDFYSPVCFCDAVQHNIFNLTICVYSKFVLVYGILTNTLVSLTFLS